MPKSTAAALLAGFAAAAALARVARRARLRRLAAAMWLGYRDN